MAKKVLMKDGWKRGYLRRGNVKCEGIGGERRWLRWVKDYWEAT